MNSLSRRAFMSSAAALGVSACMARMGPSEKAPFFERNRLPIGLQLYTLGDLLQKDLQATLDTLAKIGYRTVELAGLYGRTPKEFRAALDLAALKCSSAHISGHSTPGDPGLDGDLDRLAADMHILGAEYVIMPGVTLPPDVDLKPRVGENELQAYIRVHTSLKREDWQRSAAFLNDVGKRLAPLGLKVGYHNHNLEFAPLGETTPFEILLDETDASTVAFELDVGWVTAAGIDPVGLFGKSPGRYKLIHVKDVKASTKPNFALELQGTEVGSGKIDWNRLLPAAYAAGVRHFFVEQEPPFAYPKLESIAKSCRYLNGLVVE